MLLESLALTGLFSLAAVAFIGVLNARGLWRTIVAALLALFCLGAALWNTAAYRAARLTAAPAPADSRADSAAAARALPEAPAFGDAVSETADLAELTAAARLLLDSMAAEDPSRARGLSDSAYQAFDNRAGDYLARARMLRERAARIAASPSPESGKGLEEAAEFLTLSLQALNGAARDLKGFFRATNRDEEQRLLTGFRRGIATAEPSLRSAESRVGGAAADEFEAL